MELQFLFLAKVKTAADILHLKLKTCISSSGIEQDTWVSGCAEPRLSLEYTGLGFVLLVFYQTLVFII